MGLPELAMALAGYLLGAIPSGVIVGRAVGVDPRRAGSGRIGTTNALRTLGPAGAAAVAAMDVGKGAAAALLGLLVTPALGGDPGWGAAAGAIGAVLGHVRSIFIGFGGGRGVATGGGALAILAPLALIAAGAVMALVVWRTRYVSLGSIAATITTLVVVIVLVALGLAEFSVLVAAVAIAAIVLLAHADNIERLRAGTERKLGQREAAATDA
jgi:glycerol-3-phosphate acyltransferase PlsY